MTTTEKYKFRMMIDQFGNSVSPDYVDEQATVDLFEHICLKLIPLNKPEYSMIELGSNQAYYSLLFKHIIGKDKTFNIMVDPIPKNIDRGKLNFESNNCTGIWYNNGIGNHIFDKSVIQNCIPITLTRLFQDNALLEVDILHCDIDGGEFRMLIENGNLFAEKRINYIFLSLHSELLTEQCRWFFTNFEYEKIWDWPFYPRDVSFIVSKFTFVSDKNGNQVVKFDAKEAKEYEYNPPVYTWNFDGPLPTFNLTGGGNNGDGWLVYHRKF